MTGNPTPAENGHVDPSADAVLEQVRDYYATAARQVTGAGQCDAVAECCTHADFLDDVRFGRSQYDTGSKDELPLEAVTASMGCGNPVAVADLRDGETVLDLGSGGGIDVLLSARRVGPHGFAYGIDMTDEMLDLARRNAARAGVTNVKFLKGTMENIPLPARRVDVIISNCVINLSPDKHTVFAEAFRVLRPGGRIGVSDVVAEDHLSPADRAARGDYVGCIAGCLSMNEYRDELASVGFTHIEVTPTHAVEDGIHAAIVRAARPHESRIRAQEGGPVHGPVERHHRAG